jgi:uncharacterized protein (TIGR00369 family)
MQETSPHPMAGIVRGAIVSSPLAALLGMEVVDVGDDVVSVRLPFREAVTTIGNMVHGGAISALVDVAATAAAWTKADLARSPRGTTIGFTINFLQGALGTDLIATARVIQRGRSVQVCEVDVRGNNGEAVARAMVTYKLDHKGDAKVATA